MIYKKYDILPQYIPGSDFDINKHGAVVKRIPKPEHIDFFRSTHRVTGEQLPNSKTREEAKRFIDKMIEIEERVLTS
jgi:hypothetical protein